MTAHRCPLCLVELPTRRIVALHLWRVHGVAEDTPHAADSPPVTAFMDMLARERRKDAARREREAQR